MNRSLKSFLLFVLLVAAAVRSVAQTEQTQYEPIPTYAPPKEYAHTFRFSSCIGSSARLGKAEGEFAEITEEARRGTSYTFQLNLASKKGIGGGALIDYWKSRRGEQAGISSPSTRYYLDDQMFFAGPAFFVRAGKKAVMFTTTTAIGYYGTQSDLKVVSSGFISQKVQEIDGIGGTVGFVLDAALDIRLYRSLCIGGGFTLLTGSLTNMKIGGVKTKLSEKESLNRFTSNIGLKLWL